MSQQFANNGVDHVSISTAGFLATPLSNTHIRQVASLSAHRGVLQAAGAAPARFLPLRHQWMYAIMAKGVSSADFCFRKMYESVFLVCAFKAAWDFCLFTFLSIFGLRSNEPLLWADVSISLLTAENADRQIF
jgi:hypothetical protein